MASEDLVFRLDLLENAFIIHYETPPRPWHDLIISPPNNFFAQKRFFGKMLVLVIPQFHHFFFFF